MQKGRLVRSPTDVQLGVFVYIVTSTTSLVKFLALPFLIVKRNLL